MKKFKVTARQVAEYEKIVEATTEQEAIEIFYKTRDEYDIVKDDGLEVDWVEETKDE